MRDDDPELFTYRPDVLDRTVQKAMKDYPRLYKEALARIRVLETQLGEQATELSSLGKAAFAVRAEDSDNLAGFETTNKALIEFVEKVAESKSKFGAEARKILGL